MSDRPALAAAPLALGLFSMAAQALLFRVHLTAFGGHELGFGVFLASWLGWIGAGAGLARAFPAAVEGAASRFPLVVALYPVPAVVQALLLSNLRSLAGVAAFEVVPLEALTLATLVANAPLSLATGFLFAAACRAMESSRGAGALSAVYVLEALGGVLGGVGATLALVAGFDPGSVFLAAAAFAAVPLALEASMAWPRLIPLVGLGVALGAGAGPAFVGAEAASRWEHLLPGSTLTALVHGREGEILEGTRGDQRIVVRQGRVAAAFPDREGHGQAAALLVAEHPRARRFFLTGEAAPGVALALLELPDVATVAVAEPDEAYLAACWRGARRGPADDARLRVVVDDPRAALAESPGGWDVVAVLAGDPTTLVANRTYTLEFLQVARAALAPSGVVALRFSGGENTLGGERAELGRALLATARAVFEATALKPGDDSLLFASDGPDLTEQPATLVERLRARPGGPRLVPPDALGALFLPDRIRAARAAYERPPGPGVPVVNRDDAPVAHLASLLLAGRRAGASLAGAAAGLCAGGVVLALAAVLLATLLVLLAARVGSRAPERRRLVAAVLAGVAGFVGLGASVVLLDAFQVRHGTLYLHVGLLSAAFMGGLSAGGVVGLRLARRTGAWSRFVAPALLAGGLVLARGAVAEASLLAAAALLAVIAAAAGMLVPMAGRLAMADGGGPGSGAARVEAWDHVGAALAGAVLAFWWVPVLGLSRSLDLLTAVAVLAGVVAALDLGACSALSREGAGAACGEDGPSAQPVETTTDRLLGCLHGGGPPDPQTEPDSAMRYGLLAPQGSVRGRARVPTVGWLAVFLVLLLGFARWRHHAVADESTPALPAGVVAVLASPDTAACHFERGWCALATESGADAGYVVASKALAPDVVGYGGPLNVAARLEPDGSVRRVVMVAERETPTYRDAVVAELQRWQGFAPFVDPPVEVEAVTGATATSSAVTAALRGAARGLFRDELGRPVGQAGASSAAPPVRLEGVALAMSLLAGIGLAFRPAPRLRRWLLAVVALGVGVGLNVQVSIEPLARALQGDWPPLATGFPFVLLVGVGTVVLALGNVYCGHACPFGALQETLHTLNPFALRPNAVTWAGLRAGKYLVAAVLLTAFFATGDRSVLAADPLVGLWRLDAPGVALLVAGAGLLGAAFVPRFYCRALCPAGALLALLGSWRPLARRTRPKLTATCDLGVRRTADLDCLCCDRCLHLPAPDASTSPGTLRRPLLAGSLALLVLFLGLVGGLALRTSPLTTAGRDFRRVDEARVRALIQAGELSGHEASYWRFVTDPPTGLDHAAPVR